MHFTCPFRPERDPRGGDARPGDRRLPSRLPVSAPGVEKPLPVRDTCRETRDVQELPALDMGGDVFQPLQGIEGEGGEISVGGGSRMISLVILLDRYKENHLKIHAVVG